MNYFSRRLLGCSLVYRTVSPSTNSLKFTSLTKFRHFHTTDGRKALNPFLWKFAKPIVKLGAILFGRYFRMWWSKLPAARQRKLYETFMGRRRYFVAGGIVGGSVTVYYVATHLERTPITNRLRFVAVTGQQILEIAEVEEKLMQAAYEGKLLPVTDKQTRRVSRVVDRLLEGSNGMPGFENKTWTVSIIDSPEFNAFVLPNGHIFVFSGMLKITENDSQLSIVLGHEMSHAILNHASEQLSRAQFIDWIMIISMAFLWAFIWGDGIALVTNWFLNKCAHLALHLPYSRKLEREADTVGLEIVAKACFDVRESYTYWKKMELMEKTGEIVTPVPPFLSTHPAHGDRANDLDQLTPKCLQIRSELRCPPLPMNDPRNLIDHKLRLVDEKLALANKL